MVNIIKDVGRTREKLVDQEPGTSLIKRIRKIASFVLVKKKRKKKKKIEREDLIRHATSETKRNF